MINAQGKNDSPTKDNPQSVLVLDAKKKNNESPKQETTCTISYNLRTRNTKKKIDAQEKMDDPKPQPETTCNFYRLRKRNYRAGTL